MLALIDVASASVIGEHVEGGWINLPNGDIVSPAVDGWSTDEYALATIAAADPVPDGFCSASTVVQMMPEGPKYVHELKAIVIAPADVEAEYSRRALAGKTFFVSGYVHGNIPLEGSPRTQTVLLALKDTARDLRDAGVNDPILMLTDRDNGDHYLTPDQLIELVNAGKAYMQALHEAKRVLKTLDPIPADYADDSRWPAL